MASFSFPRSDFHETPKMAPLVVWAPGGGFGRGSVGLSPAFPLSTGYSTVCILKLRWYIYFFFFQFPRKRHTGLSPRVVSVYSSVFFINNLLSVTQ